MADDFEDEAPEFEDAVEGDGPGELDDEVPEDLEEDDASALDDETLVDDDALTDDDDPLIDDDDRGPRAVAAAANDEEDDDEDIIDPDDVEADLDTILKDRLVAADDEQPDDDDEENEVDDRGDPVDRIAPKRADEFVCRSCFLLKSNNQLADDKRKLWFLGWFRQGIPVSDRRTARSFGLRSRSADREPRRQEGHGGQRSHLRRQSDHLGPVHRADGGGDGHGPDQSQTRSPKRTRRGRSSLSPGA
jgi:hypothetical protein